MSTEPHGLPRVDFDEIEFNDDDLAFLNGEPFTGIVVAVHPNGARAENGYRNGVIEGLQRKWYPSGQLEKEGIVVCGQGTSTVTEWYENGQMKRRAYCRFGFPVRVQEWTQHGQLRRDERINLSDSLGEYIARRARELNITSWPDEEES